MKTRVLGLSPRKDIVIIAFLVLHYTNMRQTDKQIDGDRW